MLNILEMRSGEPSQLIFMPLLKPDAICIKLLTERQLEALLSPLGIFLSQKIIQNMNWNLSLSAVQSSLRYILSRGLQIGYFIIACKTSEYPLLYSISTEGIEFLGEFSKIE